MKVVQFLLPYIDIERTLSHVHSTLSSNIEVCGLTRLPKLDYIETVEKVTVFSII